MTPVYRYLLASGECVRSLPDRDIGARSGVLARLGGELLILSRALCSYSRRRLGDKGLSGQKLRRALYLEAIASSPHKKTGVFIDIGPHFAGVWTWDADLAESASGLPTRRTIPETVLHQRRDGAAIRRTLDGYEGQFWQDGALVDSRWWSREPDASQWRMFYLSAEELGIGPCARPRLDAVAFDPDRRAVNALAWQEWIGLIRPIELMAAILALLFLPTALYIGVRTVWLATTHDALRSEYGELAENYSGDRQRVADLRGRIADIRFLSDYFHSTAHPLPALADAVGVIQDIRAEIRRVSYDRGEYTLEIVMASTIDQTDVVRRLEDKPYLADVRINPGSRAGRWRLVFRTAAPPPETQADPSEADS